MSAYVEVNKKEFDRMCRLFPEKAKVEMTDVLDHTGRHFLSVFFKSRLSGPPGVKAQPSGLKTRFYRNMLPSSTLQGLGTEIYTTSPIAKIHEIGGTRKASGGGFLAVPLSFRTEIFTKSGQLKKQYKDPRNIKNVFPERINSKTFLMKRPSREKDPVKPLFVLKRSVRIKARLGFFKTWDSLESWRINRINKGMDKVMN